MRKSYIPEATKPKTIRHFAVCHARTIKELARTHPYLNEEEVLYRALTIGLRYLLEVGVEEGESGEQTNVG